MFGRLGFLLKIFAQASYEIIHCAGFSLWIITPDFFPIRLLKKLLDPPREHLEADNHIRIMGVQGGEHL